ncbi:MAG: DMT family transporter [Paraburkholderia sp.]|jgi:drug/metabolite transporter (DMT)-like permease|nr:DMT family transporter [Paraburkholderia sp.]
MSAIAWICAAGAIVLWASFATLVSHAPDVPPLLLTGLALISGSATSLHRAREWRVPLRTMMFGVVCLFVYHASLVAAFRLSPIATANLVHYLWPLLLVLLGTSAWRGAQWVSKLAGALIGFAGCVVAINSGPDTTVFSSMYAVGYSMALLAAVVWAVYSLGTRWLPPHSSWAVGGFCLGAGLLAIFSHFLFEPRFALSGSNVAWIAAIGLGPLGISFVLWDFALRRASASRIGILAYGTPVLSMLSLALAGKYSDCDWSAILVAGVLIVAGVGVASLGPLTMQRETLVQKREL